LQTVQINGRGVERRVGPNLMCRLSGENEEGVEVGTDTVRKTCVGSKEKRDTCASRGRAIWQRKLSERFLLRPYATERNGEKEGIKQVGKGESMEDR